MANYSIRDLEKLSGVKAHTIRIWEKRYNIVKPKRTSTNIRSYCDDDLKRLLNIAILKLNGIKISEIACLNQEELNAKVIYLINEDNESNSKIENLIIATIDLDERKFEKILNNSILTDGLKKTIIETIYPFLERIGVLWQTGVINPAQEHFISNLIRQKLIVAIDGTTIQTYLKNQKQFLLFLPEGELHEIGLLVYNYIIKKKGHKVIYLGQTVPFDDLVKVNEICQADYLLTSFITSFPSFDINQYLKRLSLTFSDKKIFVTGKQVLKINKLPKNVLVIDSPVNFNKKLKEAI